MSQRSTRNVSVTVSIAISMTAGIEACRAPSATALPTSVQRL